MKTNVKKEECDLGSCAMAAIFCVSMNIFLAKTLVCHILDAGTQGRRGCFHTPCPEIDQTIMGTLSFVLNWTDYAFNIF